MKRYVLGFCFLSDDSCVMIERSKQDWQHGLINGIGGSIEDTEQPLAAMIREFEEECGFKTLEKHWEHGLTLEDDDWEMHVFRGRLKQTAEAFEGHCNGEGFICCFTPDKLPPNVERTALWLYWMCRDESTFGMLSSYRPLMKILTSGYPQYHVNIGDTSNVDG